MYVATLISNPDLANLSGEIVRVARIRLGGQNIRWLSQDRACDILLPTHPEALEVTWRWLQSEQIDLVVQPISGRRKSVLVADMDSTMIRQECIDELAAEAGVGEKVAAITARAMNGELDFEASLAERMGLLAGLDARVIQSVIENRITLMPGGPVLVATMKANGAYTALVSGGFTDFTRVIAGKLGFDEHRANTLLIAAGRLTGKTGLPVLGRDAKVQALLEITARLNRTPADVIAVGDGANDLGMLHLAGSGVALHAKPAVAAECRMRLSFADLTGLLYLQGYSAADFTIPD
jgi:phosphoserine phosphatase